MIKENIKFCDEITTKSVEQLKNKNLGNFYTLFPMLRKENDKLLLGTLVEVENEEQQKRGMISRPKYWIILDNDNYNILEFNKTKEKDYMDTNIIPLDKEYEDTFSKEQKELIKYEVNKRLQYNDYFMNDIKDEIIHSSNNILKRINNKIIVDNEEIDAKDYLIANITEEIEKQVENIISLVVNNKYSAIIYYYQTLIEEILTEYKKTNNINIEKMKLASNILDEYYGEVYGIKYFFNV